MVQNSKWIRVSCELGNLQNETYFVRNGSF
jgi:hypothetical protein